MASSKKKNATAKPSLKFRDLRSKKNPKGGGTEIFLKIDGIKGESADDRHP
jgi:type VI protein secretion system component Hcp